MAFDSQVSATPATPLLGAAPPTRLVEDDRPNPNPNPNPNVVALVDHRGGPISHSSTGGWRSSSFIIGVEIAERFAYYGIASSLITYMAGPLGKSTASAAANVNAWSGTASMLPLVGGLLADSYLGRYRTILVASAIYLLGLVILTLSAVVPHFLHSKCRGNSMEDKACNTTSFHTAEFFFFFAIYAVALAQGCHKPCAEAFAADQFDENDPMESKAKSSFFNWWYCGMCVGTTAALLIVNYVQDNIGWGLGFGIPCIAMVIAIILFLLGTRTYRYYIVTVKGPSIKIVQEFLSFVGRRRNKPRNLSHRGAKIVTDTGGQAPPCTESHSRSVGASECLPPNEQHMEAKNTIPLERKGILRLFPIWATCLVYAVIFSQTTTLFTKQGSTMDGRIGPNFKVPPAALLTFISFTIVIFIPIYDLVLVPLTRNITGMQSGITMLQRIGIGQFLSLVTMFIAALVEMKRLQTARDFGLVDLPNSVVPMSLWWLVPQYMIFGIADVFTIIGMQEFFYDQAPVGLRSFGLALYLSVFGIGSFISSILVTIIDKVTSSRGDGWFSNNLNRAHIDYFYWLLSVLSGLELLLFLYFATSYSYSWKSWILACGNSLPPDNFSQLSPGYLCDSSNKPSTPLPDSPTPPHGKPNEPYHSRPPGPALLPLLHRRLESLLLHHRNGDCGEIHILWYCHQSHNIHDGAAGEEHCFRRSERQCMDGDGIHAAFARWLAG